MQEVAMPLRVLICDDETPARDELRFLLGEAGEVEVVAEASTAEEALEAVTSAAVDAVFLDIVMPGLSGMQLAGILEELDRPPAIVFVTGHPEHAVAAFEVPAADYLLKPVGLFRLKQTLARLAPREAPQPPNDRVLVEKAGKKLLLSAEDVFLVSAEGDYGYVHTDGGRFFVASSLAQLEAKLEARGFFRVHRRYLVNLSHVREVVPMYGGTMLLTLKDAGATQVPVSRRRAPAVKRVLGL
jgi:two-component system, LytTR family, response regulator LytT